MLLACLFLTGQLYSQSINMPVLGENQLVLTPGTIQTIKDPGGEDNYPPNCSSTLTIQSLTGAPITVSGNYHTEYSYDLLQLYDANSVGNNPIGSYSGIGNVNVTAYSGYLTIHFYSDMLVNNSGFNLTVTTCEATPNQVYDIEVSDITETSAIITWSDSTESSSWTISYGTTPESLSHQITTDTTTASLTGLQTHTKYYYRIYNSHSGNWQNICSARYNSFKTQCAENAGSCIAYSDLTSCYVTATYGTFGDPYQNSGIVDQGSSSGNSRHTVHSNTNERDPRTNNQLRTVPSGYTTSVRLGNWSTGAQAESITYEYKVDTLISDLLILKYAAVLQDPDHPSNRQPRFSFTIIDEQGIEINSSCYSADFIASSALGWNTTGDWWEPTSVLWKDWTTVGIDLTSLQGQTIYIRLSSYDCADGQHFGYAYFVFDCAHKTLMSSNCGSDVENTFTAPEGFSYRWYNASNPGETLTTNRSCHTTVVGEYRCTLGFIGAPDNASCTFELKAIAGERYPSARFTYDTIESDSCDMMLQMHNNSVICSDSLLQESTGEACEEVQWYVDNNMVSTQGNPIIALSQGHHTIQLVAAIANGACSDTMRREMEVVSPCTQSDTVEVTLCRGESYTLFDTTIYETGVYERDNGYHHRTAIVNILPTYDTSITHNVVENALPYQYGGISFVDSVADSTIALTSTGGCDSTIHFTLHVWRNKVTTLDSTTCRQSDTMYWNGVVFTSSATDSVVYIGAGEHGEDSIVIMSVTILEHSTYTLHDTTIENNLPYYLGANTFVDEQSDTTWTEVNGAGCDSVVTFSLHVWHNVHSTIDSSVCENSVPMQWNGVTFTETGTQSVNLAEIGIHASHGEDSIVTMTLNVTTNSSYTYHDTVVENEMPRIWDGKIFYNPVGDTSWTIPNSEGCDSTVHYSLHVWQNVANNYDTSVCRNMLPIEWHGHTFASSEEYANYPIMTIIHYVDSLRTIHNSDSVVTLIMMVYPIYNKTDTVVICRGDTCRYGMTEEGTYTVPYESVNGCDSIIHVTLEVKEVYHETYYDTICSNESTEFGGETINTEGEHNIRYATVDGCDSTQTLLLTVYNTSHTFDNAKVCDGVPYTWIDGNSYAHSTTEPEITMSDIHGCDSTVHLVLELDDQFQAEMEISPRSVTMSNPEVRLHDKSRSARRRWYTGEKAGMSETAEMTEIDTCRIVTFAFPANSDTLQVLLVAFSTAGCIDSVWGAVNCDRSTLWAPNAFTPDESQNNKFFIASNELKEGRVWIYNRQGLLISTFEALSGWWDGTYKGKPCPQATYTWIMQYKTLSKPHQTQEARGTVTLLR